MMRRKTWNDDELVQQYIMYQTLQNIANRKKRGLGSKKYIQIIQIAGADLHDIKQAMFYRKIRVMQNGTEKSETEFLYSVYKNGWRSDHSMPKADIQKEVSLLWTKIESSLRDDPIS